MKTKFQIPDLMKASAIRTERMGNVETAFQFEDVAIPKLLCDEVLVKVKYAGVNYNAIWAAKGIPINVIDFRNRLGETEKFHIAGSDASGIIVGLGSEATEFKIGDEVILHPGYWDAKEDWILSGGDPILANSIKAWGYETNYGSFAEYTKVKITQCLRKPKSLSWEDAASFLLCGATAYRMLTHWKPNQIKKGDVVLIWGGSGGLGSFAIQLVKHFGGIPVAVVNSESKKEFCFQNGAAYVINRNDYSHWGFTDFSIEDKDEFRNWKNEVKRFETEIYTGIGKKIAPAIVFEHPGENTFPTSLAICKKGGMVVACGASTGYRGSFDLRFLWMNQKRIQGSHFADLKECKKIMSLVAKGFIQTNISRIFSFEEIGLAHSILEEGKIPIGNLLIRIENKKNLSEHDSFE
jgi:crotonyl-CoA carboxylase/reductase